MTEIEETKIEETEVKEERIEPTEVEEKAEEKTEKPVETPKPTRSRADDYTVFIGAKPFMNYVTAVVMQFTTQNAKNVLIKSRGKFISRAVDVAEVVRGRFMKDQIDVTNIDIGSESFENKEGRQVSVSTINIELAKR